MTLPSLPSPLTLTAFQPDHAARLCLRPSAGEVLAGLGPLHERARAYAAAGPAWTLLAGDWPLVCGGAVRFWPGVGELWCWTGAEAGHWAIGVARLAGRCVAELFAAHGFHRLQAHVREDDARARSFARFLGLTLEGRCPGYGPDQATHLLYGRFEAWKASAR